MAPMQVLLRPSGTHSLILRASGARDLHQNYQYSDHEIDENARITPAQILSPKNCVRLYIGH